MHFRKIDSTKTNAHPLWVKRTSGLLLFLWVMFGCGIVRSQSITNTNESGFHTELSSGESDCSSQHPQSGNDNLPQEKQSQPQFPLDTEDSQEEEREENDDSSDDEWSTANKATAFYTSSLEKMLTAQRPLSHQNCKAIPYFILFHSWKSFIK